MDGAEVKQGHGHGLQGQDVIPPLNDNFSHVFSIHLINDEILKYLDGSALIQLGSVSRGIRQLVTSSSQYKKKVNLKVKTMEFFMGDDPLPGWVANMKNLTLTMIYDVGRGFDSLKFLSLARTLPCNLSTLVVANESFSYYSLNKILKLSSQLKSLSIPCNMLLDQIDFDHVQNLEELKFTTSTYMVKFNTNFEENLAILATKCIKLKSFSCQEVSKVGGRYVNDIEEENRTFLQGILPIIEKNSQSLVKLEFGISQLVVGNPTFSSKLAKISLPNLKFLDLRMKKDVNPELPPWSQPTVRLDILKNLPKPEQLTTLKLTFTSFPLELFNLIPQKFPQLKNLSLKASMYSTNANNVVINGDRWSFLQSLTALEELEITRFITDYHESDFGHEISHKLNFLQQHNNLRKLSLKGMKGLDRSTFFNGLGKMIKLKDLELSGCFLTFDDFLTICTNLKDLEKLQISHLLASKLNNESTTRTIGGEIDYREILTVFSSLKYLKELSIDIWSGDFRKVLGSISFPYLKSLTLSNANLSKEEFENLIGSNGMLKEISIFNLKYGDYEDLEEKKNERNNLEIRFSSKRVELSPIDDREVRDDFDPDSKPLSEQNIEWDDPESFEGLSVFIFQFFE